MKKTEYYISNENLNINIQKSDIINKYDNLDKLKEFYEINKPNDFDETNETNESKETNLSKELSSISITNDNTEKLANSLDKLLDFKESKRSFTNIDEITTDCDNSISSIMNFISESNTVNDLICLIDTNTNSNQSINKINNTILNTSINKVDNIISSSDTQLNLLDELELLKNNKKNNEIYIHNDLQNNEQDDISEFIVQNIEVKQDNLSSKFNSENGFVFKNNNRIKSKADDENFDIINVDDIDFGLGIGGVDYNNVTRQVKSKNNLINSSEKKINVIRIGKKK